MRCLVQYVPKTTEGLQTMSGPRSQCENSMRAGTYQYDCKRVRCVYLTICIHRPAREHIACAANSRLSTAVEADDTTRCACLQTHRAELNGVTAPDDFDVSQGAVTQARAHLRLRLSDVVEISTLVTAIAGLQDQAAR